MVEQLAPDDVIDDGATTELRRGTRLGRYELLLPIAKGGMARVWAARQHGIHGFSKTVAIKTILPNLAEEPEFERMFLDEARIAALVHHPNVCEIYELGEEGKVLYLAMEWISGESLVHILRSSGKMAPMDARLASRIVADACAGLHAAHNLTDEQGRPMNVVHRDVSPHNILISADGNVKVADFGVAKALGQMHSATMAGQVKGKIGYMAPEMITGAPVDRRSDIFAMGIVLYEATTGQRPFTGEGDPQVMHAILQGKFTLPSRIIRSYPPELEKIVLQAMSMDPAQRFHTADRMRHALEEWLAHSGSIVSQSHVGHFVQQRVGSTLSKRRERIRAAANAPAPGDISASGAHVGVGPTTGTPSVQSVVSGVQQAGASPWPTNPPTPAPSVPGSDASSGTGPALTPQGPSTGKYLVAAAIGVLVATLIGVAGIFALRAHQGAGDKPVPTAPATDTAVPTAVTPKEPAPTTSAAPSVAPSATPPAAGKPIAITGLPDGAVLTIDGTTQDPSMREVPRPAAGKTTDVVIHAAGFQDFTKTLDDQAPPSLEVKLTPTPAPTPHPATTSAGTSAHGGKTGSPAPSSTTPDLALPANPY